jgi:hypothetical protein
MPLLARISRALPQGTRMLRLWNQTRLWVVVTVLAIVPLARAADEYVISPSQKNHWAWKPPVRTPLPPVQNAAWCRNPIDVFILAKLEQAGLHAALPAAREQLLRRVTLDLIGLPPTPAETEAFLHDPSPNAWEKVVDRFLASPHYGERWGRHWLDLARFAESNGYEHDETRPDAWRYRDYVINSFNADKPYDRFIGEQLAGDELFPTDSQALVATGFNLHGPDMTDAADPKQRRQNTLNDMTDTVALVYLGLTVACARCHDHKFEPLPQTDYYRLQAFFTPADFRRDLPIATSEQRAAFAAALKAYHDLTQSTRDALTQLEEPSQRRLHDERLTKLSDEAQAAHRTPQAQRTAAQKELVDKTTRLLAVTPQSLFQALSPAAKARYKELQSQLKKFDRFRPQPLPVAMGLQDPLRKPEKTFLLERGELENPAEEVQPGFPIILTADQVERPVSPDRSRRGALASWIAHSDNPLTARVLVNRLWQHHFGRGLVATTSDFGVRGERPTHPELLDWLATEFVAPSPQPLSPEGRGVGVRGWSLKQMHRLMLTSATYQQASRATPAAQETDPDNQLFSHMNRLRLEGEVIRDSLLAVSGRLNPQMRGPGVFPPIPAEALQGHKAWTISANPQDHDRRSVYVFCRRNLRFPFLETFDLPDSTLSCPKRERSTTAPQGLALLNASEVLEAANTLASRLLREAGSEDERLTRLYQWTLGRQPSARERHLARAFLADSPLSELCRALFNINEFVYVD